MEEWSCDTNNIIYFIRKTYFIKSGIMKTKKKIHNKLRAIKFNIVGSFI